jgi:mono/diheme cytochrome c family protein
MDMIARALVRDIGSLIRYNAHLLNSGLAGGCGFVIARRNLAPAPARFGELTMSASARRSVPVAIIFAGATAAAADTPSSDGSFMSPQRFMQRDGQVIYHTVCQGCHMPDAQGAVGAGAYPALAKDPKLAEAEYPVLVVVNGSKGMPPFGKLLDDEQVAAVVNYVRSHFGNSYPDSVSPADVGSARP